MGLYDEMYKVGRENGSDERIVRQLSMFQQNTG